MRPGWAAASECGGVSRGKWLVRGAGVGALWTCSGRGRAASARRAGAAGRAARSQRDGWPPRVLRSRGGDDARRRLSTGWAFDSLAAWHRVIPLLGEGVRVLAMDLRSHGKSDRVRGWVCGGPGRRGGRCARFPGPARYTVVGYSLGGMAAEAVLRHPARGGAPGAGGYRGLPGARPAAPAGDPAGGDQPWPGWASPLCPWPMTAIWCRAGAGASGARRLAVGDPPGPGC